MKKFILSFLCLLAVSVIARAGDGEGRLSVAAGFEWDYVFPSGIRFSLIQKNNVNFLHGDTFRNGLLIGFKFPL